jgi:hypothetical protein
VSSPENNKQFNLSVTESLIIAPSCWAYYQVTGQMSRGKLEKNVDFLGTKGRPNPKHQIRNSKQIQMTKRRKFHTNKTAG